MEMFLALFIKIIESLNVYVKLLNFIKSYLGMQSIIIEVEYLIKLNYKKL